MARPRTRPLPRGIYTRSLASGTHYGYSVQHDGQQVQVLVGPDLATAERARALALREIAAGTFRRGAACSARPTLAEHFPTWIQFLRNEGRVRTVDATERMGNLYLIPLLGEMRLDEIRPRHVADAVQTLTAEGRISPKYVRNVHGVLSAYLTRARFEELVTENAAKGLPRGILPKNIARRERQPWRLGEVGILISDERVREDRRVLYAIAAFTGARLGEVAGMRWRDLDRAAEPLVRWKLRSQYDGLPLKTERPRDIPIHPELLAILDAWRVDGFPKFMLRDPRPEDFVVPADRSGACHTNASFGSKDLRRRARAVGLDTTNRDLHSFRRFFITTSREQSVDRDVLEKITHNARGNILDVYTRFAWAPLCRVIQALPLARPHDTGHDERAGSLTFLVESRGIEPLTSSMPSRRSPI